MTSKFADLEPVDKMVERVNEAAKMVAKGAGGTVEQALQRMGVSPQCGFASHSDGNSLGHDDMVKKLKLIRAVADEVWPGEP